ncbi:hypothetical protein TNIN_175161 [Trichonephila inaurata madagascariensis]|uniref:Uncharacterized protein n=1 Tax=Trichonephila inaurata madagascariensis TaxID=2747483 RepID=A0A8X6XIZ5_9ARAC|nr:hypothetical protein TNIN_175161 [Trichonephila inaurata madagascariensis]
MEAIAAEILKQQGAVDMATRIGYHWPPFISINHLHLHVIAPEEELSIKAKVIFQPSTKWFLTVSTPFCHEGNSREDQQSTLSVFAVKLSLEGQKVIGLSEEVSHQSICLCLLEDYGEREVAQRGAVLAAGVRSFRSERSQPHRPCTIQWTTLPLDAPLLRRHHWVVLPDDDTPRVLLPVPFRRQDTGGEAPSHRLPRPHPVQRQ